MDRSIMPYPRQIAAECRAALAAIRISVALTVDWRTNLVSVVLKIG